ncbi:MAG: hypothetical protein M1541_01745 [Acidobacteria bacterium]|nr:hypothetical protein [Acidobacteriota bacterium]
MVWRGRRDYNRRANMEDRIAELNHDLNADHFGQKEFHATEAAFRSVPMLFNLRVEFQRAGGMPGCGEPTTMRTQLLTCAAVPGRSTRRFVLHSGER